MPTLSSQLYVFDPRPDFPFRFAVKRLWDPLSPYLQDEDAYTLIMVHGTGFHKEHWEPVLDDLYGLLLKQAGGVAKVREAWCLDTYNHGDSALLNENVLTQGYDKLCSWEDIARGIHLFLSGKGTGIDIDFSKRKLAGIGHSSGAVGLILSTTYHPRVKYSLLHLVEPMILPTSPPGIPNVLEAGAVKRRDIWPSKEEAMKAFNSRPSWQVWDPRILQTYVEHGLTSLPTLSYPDVTKGVTLKCPRHLEAASYRDGVTRTRAFWYLPTLVQRYPVHILYGAVSDYYPGTIKEDVINNAGASNLASIVWAEGAGHLITQVNPTRLAGEIAKVLAAPIPAHINSKL
ncbi:hypothetical protein BDN71DRAFT_1451172 [Pleurotus eryngii]|uniref:AB hydrolase-1 domain-containing protein n=1 Tax=Pleurotus eryngii TaxID=5323 RepID=A0A9P5ZRL7_PLEER|nr:hypothetical protein BDN71DRAFT_1451172 [Pleurotus eryngii]